MIPPENIKIKKATGNVKAKKDEPIIEVAERLSLNDVVKFIAGTSVETVEEALKVGYEVLKDFYYVAKAEGYDSVHEFLKDAVSFYLNWKEKLPQIIEENKKLKAYISLIKPYVVKKLAELKRADMIQSLMLYSLISNADKELVEFWYKKIDEWYNTYARETIRISLSDIEYSEGEDNGTKREDKGSSSKKSKK